MAYPHGHPSEAGRAQERESSPARERRSTTVPRHQLPISRCYYWHHIQHMQLLHWETARDISLVHITVLQWCFNALLLLILYKKLSYRRGTARCVASVEILPIATQQCRNYTCTTSYEPSISCRQLTRATKSCCRQRLTICAINYSGRASELGGIIDRRQPSLSRSERLPFSS